MEHFSKSTRLARFHRSKLWITFFSNIDNLLKSERERERERRTFVKIRQHWPTCATFRPNVGQILGRFVAKIELFRRKLKICLHFIFHTFSYLLSERTKPKKTHILNTGRKEEKQRTEGREREKHDKHIVSTLSYLIYSIILWYFCFWYLYCQSIQTL